MNFFHELWMTYMDLAPYLMFGLAVAGLLHVVFPKRLILKHMGKRNFGSVVKAAALGVPLPLCSCGVVPTALHLRKNGASKGATLSFLISTPQTGVDSIAATYGMMGPVFAVFRPVVALIMGILGGIVANRTLYDPPIAKEIETGFHCDLCDNHSPHRHRFWNRLWIGARYAFIDFFDDISLQLLFGLLLAALISWLIPDDFFARYGGQGAWGMLLVMLLGIPLYVCATASIPIAVSLILKGISPGAAFMFLVTGPATNAATIAMIMNAMGKQFVALYLIVIAVGAMVFGLLLNGIFHWLHIDPMSSLLMMHHNMATMSLFSWIVIIAFTLLFVMSLIRKLGPKLIRRPLPKSEVSMAKFMFHVEGMSCNHCVRHVEEAIREVPGVTAVKVDLNGKCAEVDGEFPPEAVEQAIDHAGYKGTKA